MLSFPHIHSCRFLDRRKACYYRAISLLLKAGGWKSSPFEASIPLAHSPFKSSPECSPVAKPRGVSRTGIVSCPDPYPTIPGEITDL